MAAVEKPREIVASERVRSENKNTVRLVDPEQMQVRANQPKKLVGAPPNEKPQWHDAAISGIDERPRVPAPLVVDEANFRWRRARCRSILFAIGVRRKEAREHRDQMHEYQSADDDR